jgi:hypothetical protein
MTYKTKGAALVACMLAMLAIGVASAPQNAFAQIDACTVVPPTQQTALFRPIPLGISGGNNRSIIKDKKGRLKGCFSGTLGSMVQDSANNQYILSNNHVLADQNLAKPGEPIVQPGLVDTQCVRSQSNAVATFSNAIKLRFGGHKNFVDAAIAAVAPGDVSPQILFIGDIASTVVSSPVIGMAVQKMGRTSCLTTGVIAALDANVTVNYSDTMKPHLASFVNQILVTGNGDTPTFSAAGDSGSLIVTQDDCPLPVALLFAGSTNGAITIANPISAVLSRLNVSMVGTCTALASATPSADALAANIGMSKEVVASAKAVRDRHEDQLMSIPGAVGSGIAAGDQPGQPAIVVYVTKMTPQVKAAAPKDVEGTPVKVTESGEIVAY